MSATELIPTIPPPTDKTSLAKYHVVVFAFFLLSWFAQYMAFAKYLPYIPEKVRGLLQALFIPLFVVNSGFYISLVPLGVVFIFCWLYLWDIHVDLRKLYQIVVISIVPLIVLMLGMLFYTSLVMKVEPSVSQRLTEVFNSILNNPNQSAPDPATKTQMEELIKARQQDASAIKPFWLIASALSCLVCGHLLYRRLKVAAWKAILIPVTFAISIVIVRSFTNAGAGSLMDSIKQSMKP